MDRMQSLIPVFFTGHSYDVFHLAQSNILDCYYSHGIHSGLTFDFPQYVGHLKCGLLKEKDNIL